ncbi:MAG TPA: hypothetical protein VG371_14485 [Solirubrobacteraceae bacterium]|jgi:hypothetical protein|nr:hypothetical protein [Solirubrobacteraceae bacterium]
MSAFNALVDGYAANPAPAPPTDSNAGATMGASMGPSLAGQHVADLQGMPPLTGNHNTPLQVAFLGLVALGIVILLRRAGFRFSLAGKLSAGGR